jgi:hypothetical protein
MRIADDPGILSVKDVPVSLWLRSDPDETMGEDDGNTVVRICTQGQDTNDTVSVLDRVSASHPVHYGHVLESVITTNRIHGANPFFPRPNHPLV